MYNFKVRVNTINVVKSHSTPNFRARLIMPQKEETCKLAGNVCAEHLEIARPMIERIANGTNDLELIRVTPSLIKDTKYSQIQFDVLSKKGTSLTKVLNELQVNKEMPVERPLHKHIIDALIDTIGLVRMREAILAGMKTLKR